PGDGCARRPTSAAQPTGSRLPGDRPMKRLTAAVTAIALCLGSAAYAPLAAQQQLLDYDTIHHPVVDDEAMVVSQNELASRIGARVMAEGGNAVDAAVATGFALAVTLPRAGNLGGGGFM